MSKSKSFSQTLGSDAADPSIIPFDLVLGFRCIKGGAFHGLWQLYKLHGSQEIPIGGATSKMLVINMARNEIARCNT